jgi:hypothetical protein
MPLLDLIVEFATTGRLGPLAAGMPAAEAWAALGRPPEPAGDGNYRINSLDFAVRDGAVYVLGLEHEGDFTFSLPAALGGQRSDHRPVTHDEVVAALAARGCRTEPVLTVPGWSTVLRAGKVHLSFVPPTESESPPDQLMLSNVGRSAEWQGDAP